MAACASGNYPCFMVWLKQSFAIAEIKVDCSFPFPYIPVLFIFITKIINACNNIFLVLVFALPLCTYDLLFDVPIFVGFGYGGAAAVRIII